MPWCRLSRGTLLVKPCSSGKPSPLNDDSLDACGGKLKVQAATVLALEAKSRLQGRMALEVAKLTRASVEAVEMVRWLVAGVCRHRQNDVSLCRNAGSGVAALWRVSWVLEVLVWRCRASLPNVLVSFLKCLMTRCILVAGPLLVVEQSSGVECDSFCFEFPGDRFYWSFSVITCTSASPSCDF